MSVTEVTYSIKNKCGGCEYWERRSDHEWYRGNCTNELSKVKSKKDRMINAKACVQFKACDPARFEES